MSKFVVLLSLLVACKADPAPTAGTASGSPAAQQPGTKTRSGKIDFGSGMRAHLADGSADHPDESRPHWDAAKRDEMKAKFDQMRKERDTKIDTDGDGKVSEAERNVARHDRAVSMRTRMDDNGDGKVSIDELAKNGGRMTRRLGDAASIDTNHDGDISAAEIETALASRGQGRRDGSGSDGSAAPQ